MSSSSKDNTTIEAKHHPMEGATIDTAAQKSDHESSASSDRASSSLFSEDFDDDTSSDNDFQDFSFETSINAWDQITELTEEITSSLMAKQASVLCGRFRRESLSLQAGPPVKKRKALIASPASPRPGVAGARGSSETAVVTSDDDETTNNDVANAGPAAKSTTSDQDGGLPKSLYEHVDRIGRMSKLIMEISYCQRELRSEMMAMKALDEER